MKILVIAQEPQIVSSLSHYFESRGRAYLVCSVAEISEESNLDAFLRNHSISLVLNAASVSLLKKSTDNEWVAGVQELAEICHRNRVVLMQLSSSLVFDGLDGGRHREIDEALPASRIGAVHWQMEQAVRAHCERHVVVRTMPLFSGHPDNLLSTLIAQFKAGNELAVSTGGKSAPVSCDDLARVLSGVVDQLSCGANAWGTYHYCASDPANHFQFAEAVLMVASQFIDTSGASLTAIESPYTEWPQPLLNCNKIRTTFGIKQLPWRSSIGDAVKQALGVTAD